MFFGAFITLTLGLGGFGWMTAGMAQSQADEQAAQAVTVALVPICVERAIQDPAYPEVIARMNLTSNTNRTRFVIQAGWATILQGEEPNLVVANACMNRLMAQR